MAAALVGCSPKKGAAMADEDERTRPWFHGIDYRKQDGAEAGYLVNRGFWLHALPRLLLVCRLFGHRPVIDGTEDRPTQAGARWVCCDRCGLRPNIPRPANGEFPIGQRCPWPIRSTAWPAAVGVVGGQLVIGKRSSGDASVSVKIGNAGSEHTLAGQVTLGRLGGLYLHSEQFGTWLQRRLNPVGYHSRVIEVGLSDWRLRWRFWAKRDEWSSDTPRWRDGSLNVDPRDRLLGPVRVTYETHGEPVTAAVRLPDGDDHEVVFELQRVVRARRRGRSRASWSAEWTSEAGVPYRTPCWKGNGVCQTSEPIPDAAVDQDRWVEVAAAKAALHVTELRGRYRWRPERATTTASEAATEDVPAGR